MNLSHTKIKFQESLSILVTQSNILPENLSSQMNYNNPNTPKEFVESQTILLEIISSLTNKTHLSCACDTVVFFFQMMPRPSDHSGEKKAKDAASHHFKDLMQKRNSHTKTTLFPAMKSLVNFLSKSISYQWHYMHKFNELIHQYAVDEPVFPLKSLFVDQKLSNQGGNLEDALLCPNETSKNVEWVFVNKFFIDNAEKTTASSQQKNWVFELSSPNYFVSKQSKENHDDKANQNRMSIEFLCN